MPFIKSPSRGQTSLEYLLLLTVVAVIVIASFRTGSLIDQVHDSAQGYFNTVTKVIMGARPAPIKGGWCPVTCPASGSYGFNIMYRACECPAPAFGGAPCPAAGTEDDSCQAGQTCRGAEVICNGVNACGPCPTGQVCTANGCACPDSLNCAAIIPGSIPDASCTKCICPSGQPLEGGRCGCCPYGYTLSGNQCVPVQCGQYSTLYDTGIGCETSCECDTGAYSYFNQNNGQCTYCPPKAGQGGAYWNSTTFMCDYCPVGKEYNATTATCTTPSCSGANMFWDTNPTDAGYLSCECYEGPTTNFEYDPTTKGCIATGSCPVTMPSGASVCPNTKKPTSGGNWSLVASRTNCSGTTNCQAYCNTGVLSNGQCVSSTCPATLPPHTIACSPASTAAIPAGEQWNLVYNCDNAKPCEAVCDPNPSNPFALECNGTSSNNNGTYVCSGAMQCQSIYLCPTANLPKNTFPCPNDPNNFPPNVPPGTTQWAVVANATACGNAPCEAYTISACTLGSGCAGKICGADNCGNSAGCGTCPYSGQTCSANQTQCTCPAANIGKCPVVNGVTNTCGPDICGNPNGCGGTNACSATQVCSSGQCVCKAGVCPSGIHGSTISCGPDTCGNYNGCGACPIGQACDLQESDVKYGECIPCPKQNVCPRGHVCGPDTCGFANGCGGATPCPVGQNCDLTSPPDNTYGQCICKPTTACGPASCGVDNCNTPCPLTCGAGTACLDGQGNPVAAFTPGTCSCSASSCPSPGVCVTGLNGTTCDCPSLPAGSVVCPVTIPETVSGSTGSGSCPVGCSGGPITATCSNGTWAGTPSGTCALNTCSTLGSHWTACSNNPVPPTTSGNYTLDASCPATPANCQATCSAGYVYSGGTCVACGALGEPCCTSGTSCSHSTCTNGTCTVNTCSSLGATWAACVNNVTPPTNSGNYSLVNTCPTTPANCQAICATGYAYSGGSCVACGGAGQPCCTSGTSCSGGGVCSSGTCDATVWWEITMPGNCGCPKTSSATMSAFSSKQYTCCLVTNVKSIDSGGAFSLSKTGVDYSATLTDSCSGGQTYGIGYCVKDTSYQCPGSAYPAQQTIADNYQTGCN